MPYSLSEVRSFFEKDAKTNISILVQSAFNKAVDVVNASSKGDLTKEQILERVLPLRDMFFNENQGKIEYETKKFLDANPIQFWYLEQKEKDEAVKEAQENIIDAGCEI